MTPAQLRKIALALEGVSEVPHMDRTAFRTTRKIFCTLGSDRRVNIKIEPAERREGLLESFPDRGQAHAIELAIHIDDSGAGSTGVVALGGFANVKRPRSRPRYSRIGRVSRTA